VSNRAFLAAKFRLRSFGTAAKFTVAGETLHVDASLVPFFDFFPARFCAN
jgi:hypothetical protein